MSNDSAIPSVDDIQRKVEEYETTIMALRAFCKIITDYHKSDDSSVVCHTSYGRRMSTSANNRVHPSNTATPDAVIQIGDYWGMIVEAKRTMPKNNNDCWRDTVNQMRKYDDKLQGWWTANGELSLANVALLVDVDRSIDFSRYVQLLIDGNKVPSFQGPTAIIEFFKKQEVKQFLRVRQVWGRVEPQELAHKLESGKSIPVEGLIDGQRFYDEEPEAVEYTMVLLWQTIFTERYFGTKFDETAKVWLIEVDLDELTEYLQKLYGHKSNEARERTFPRKKWIQKALEAFVLLNLAVRSGEKNKYIIKFRRLRGGDLFQRFYKHRGMAKKKNAKENPSQPELFEVNKIENSLNEIDDIEDTLSQEDE
jgi:hypothetical protein